jgi:hypothetical protein
MSNRAIVAVALHLMLSVPFAFGIDASASEEIKCSRLVQLKCGEHATFSVAFDIEREVAMVTPVKGGFEEGDDGDLKAAQCYAEHWQQIPLLEKSLRNVRMGKGKLSSPFTFEISQRCEGAGFTLIFPLDRRHPVKRHGIARTALD